MSANPPFFSITRIPASKASLRKLDEMITLLPIDRRKQLMRLIFERIVVSRPTGSVTWINATKEGKNPRMFRIELRMTTDWTAEDMEQTEFGSVKPRANARLKFTVEFPYNSNGVSARILESDLAIALTETAKVVEPAEVAVDRENVILRAKRYSQALAEDSTLTSTALAKREGVSSATLSFHKKVLTLAPSIVQVLARCRDYSATDFLGHGIVNPKSQCILS